MDNSIPANVTEALGTLIMWSLSRPDLDVDAGIYVAFGPAFALGEPGRGIPLGHWRFDLRRLSPPETQNG